MTPGERKMVSWRNARDTKEKEKRKERKDASIIGYWAREGPVDTLLNVNGPTSK